MNSVMQGAQLFLQAQGIKDRREQQKWLQKFQEMQMQTQGLEQQWLVQKIAEQQEGRTKQREYESALKGAFGPKPVEGGAFTERPLAPPGKEAEFYTQGALPIMAQYPSMEAPPFVKMAQGLMPEPSAEWKPKTKEEAIEFEREKAGLKPKPPWHPTTEEEAQKFEQFKAGLRKPLAEVNIDIREKAYTKIGQQMGEEVVKEHKDTLQAVDSLKRLKEAKKLLSSGMITGYGADFIINAGKALQRVGFNVGKDPIANTEAYAAMMGNQVGQIIKQFGAGTGLSDADREYAEKIAGGRITLTEESLRKIININEKGLKNAIQNFNIRAKEVMSKPGASELPYSLMIDLPSDFETDNIGSLRERYKY